MLKFYEFAGQEVTKSLSQLIKDIRQKAEDDINALADYAISEIDEIFIDVKDLDIEVNSRIEAVWRNKFVTEMKFYMDNESLEKRMELIQDAIDRTEAGHEYLNWSFNLKAVKMSFSYEISEVAYSPQTTPKYTGSKDFLAWTGKILESEKDEIGHGLVYINIEWE